MTILSRFFESHGLPRLGVLAFLALACSSTLDSPDGAAGSGGGGGGTTGAGGSGGTTGVGGTTAVGGSGTGGGGVGGNCTWANGGGDPEPAPLSCDNNNWSLLDQVSATVEASQVRLEVAWCGSCNSTALCSLRGHAENLQIEVVGSWATLVDQQASSPTCTDVVAHLLPAGAVQGDIRITGSFAGQDQCHQPLTCPLDERFSLMQESSGFIDVFWLRP